MDERINYFKQQALSASTVEVEVRRATAAPIVIIQFWRSDQSNSVGWAEHERTTHLDHRRADAKEIYHYTTNYPMPYIFNDLILSLSLVQITRTSTMVRAATAAAAVKSTNREKVKGIKICPNWLR